VYYRPDRLATDSALVADALRDLIVTLRAEGESARIVVLLEPTGDRVDVLRREPWSAKTPS
jgi:hypothetical protein